MAATLIHLSGDDGVSALCGKVKRDALCDKEEPLESVSCSRCKAKVAK
jgi:hypothetical protein